jgi:ABC-2 type transport system ATP-binding protein
MIVRAEGNYLFVDGAEHPSEVTRRLAQQELYVSELIPVRAGLESVFLELTADEGLGGDR